MFGKGATNSSSGIEYTHSSNQPMAASVRQLAGRLALVTGSSSGIGLGVAEALAAQGSDLIIHGVESVQALQAVSRRMATEFNVKCYVSDCNLLGGEDAIAEMINVASTQADRPVDILVNNAGIQVCSGLIQLAALRTSAFRHSWVRQ